MIVYFSKRITVEMIEGFYEALISGLSVSKTPPSNDKPHATKVSASAAVSARE